LSKSRKDGEKDERGGGQIYAMPISLSIRREKKAKRRREERGDQPTLCSALVYFVGLTPSHDLVLEDTSLANIVLEDLEVRGSAVERQEKLAIRRFDPFLVLRS
jgi:hypothetical protein